MQSEKSLYPSTEKSAPTESIKWEQKETLSVGIVIPTLNEEKNIGEVLQNLRTLGFRNVLVIDGKSKDGTTMVAKKNGAKVVLQTGKGKGAAIKQVLTNKYLDVDVLVMMDADGSMSPTEIPAFIRSLKSGADIVKGSRFLKNGFTEDMTFLRRFGNKLMVTAVNILFSAKFTDLCYGYAIFNSRSVELLAPSLESQNFEIETEIFLKAINRGLTVKEIPSTELKRRNGQSNLNTFRDGLRIFQTIFKEFMYGLEPTVGRTRRI